MENNPIFTTEHISNYKRDDVSENDVMGMHTILSSSLRENECKIQSTSSEEIENYDKAKEVDINVTPFTYKQLNVEDCLLELENIEENSFQNVDSNIGNSEIVNYKFNRYTLLRNTISCLSNIHKPRTVKYETLETPSIYATWSRHGKQANTKKTLIMNQENLSIAKELMQNSSLANESKDLELPENNTVSKLENSCSNNPNSVQILSNDQIFQNLIEQSELFRSEILYERPRQIGRRAERCVRLLNTNNIAGQNTDNVNFYNLRPMSAPVSSGRAYSELCNQNPMVFVRSNDSSTHSLSINAASDNSHSEESLGISNNMTEGNTTNEQHMEQSTVSGTIENFGSPQNLNFNSFWPHKLNRMLALISCTLGLFNVSRFACLTINYGGNFLIQFLILSIIFGIPFLWLQQCLGAKIKAGPIAMWKISPICSGIGLSLVLIQYFITIYSSVAVVWILIYLADLFMHQSPYPWTETIRSTMPAHGTNVSINLTESVSDYFNTYVLQRLHIFQINESNRIHLHINDRLAFYLAILWTFVFVIFCKGLKSFGKTLFILGFLPIGLLVAITAKLLYVVDIKEMQNIFSSSEFIDFFFNTKTWFAAAQEAFLTWGLLGASTISISSRNYKDGSTFSLRREAILVAMITLTGLCLSALVGLCTIQILNQFGYIYVPGSYENPEFYSAIYSVKALPSGEFISFPSKYVPHYSGFIGEVYRRHEDLKNVSGYQVLRFVSELLPAAAAISADDVSWIWAAVIFIMLLTFGFSQICVMWKPICNSLGNSTSSIFLSCVTGLLLSIPFATEIGITLLHYMDILMGGAWFIPVIWAAEIFGVFLIRGRPYNGDDLVKDLKLSGCLSTFLALSWNILLPIGLLALAVINFKTSFSSQLYYWRGRSSFSDWSRKIGAFTQITFLLLIPITAIVQIYRYLSAGPPDILDRIQMLYRPLNEADFENENVLNIPCRHVNQSDIVRRQPEDAPPKYTPPPSYTTATGARLAKLFRQSIRYSMRGILREPGRSAIQVQAEMQNDNYSSAPIFSNVQNCSQDNNLTEGERIEVGPLNHRYHRFHGRCLSLRQEHHLQNRRFWDFGSEETSAFPNYSFYSFPTRRMRMLANKHPHNAEDVITILKTSTIYRRGFSQPTRSIENLVINAERPEINCGAFVESANRSNQNFSNLIQ